MHQSIRLVLFFLSFSLSDNLEEVSAILTCQLVGQSEKKGRKKRDDARGKLFSLGFFISTPSIFFVHLLRPVVSTYESKLIHGQYLVH